MTMTLYDCDGYDSDDDKVVDDYHGDNDDNY